MYDGETASPEVGRTPPAEPQTAQRQTAHRLPRVAGEARPTTRHVGRASPVFRGACALATVFRNLNRDRNRNPLWSWMRLRLRLRLRLGLLWDARDTKRVVGSREKRETGVYESVYEYGCNPQSLTKHTGRSRLRQRRSPYPTTAVNTLQSGGGVPSPRSFTAL